MSTEPIIDDGRNFLVYDGDCPVCANYVVWTAVRRARPDILLLDARREPELVAQLRAKGVEANDVMYAEIDGVGYAGAEVMARLSDFIPDDAFGRRALKRLTGRAALTRALYPSMVAARKLLLTLLGRGRIS